MDINIGLDASVRKQIADGLKLVLADSYMLYVKTHCFHWNVTGPMFETLHLLFDAEYNDIWLALDEIAERIRALGFYAPMGALDFAKGSKIQDENTVPKAEEMIKKLVMGHEQVIRMAREVAKVAAEANDDATIDLLTRRIAIHEKNAWMLRSLVA